MRSVLKKVHDGLNTRTGFFILTLVLLWIKTYAVYVNKFSLGINDSMQDRKSTRLNSSHIH